MTHRAPARVVAALVATTALASVVGLARPAHACTPPRGVASGIEAEPASTTVPRDAGILLRVRYADVATSAVVAQLTPSVTLDGAPVEVEARLVDDQEFPGGRIANLVLVPKAPLPAGRKVEVRVSGVNNGARDDSGKPTGEVTMAFDVANVTLADLDLAAATPTRGHPGARPPGAGELGRAPLAPPTSPANSGPAATTRTTEVRFPMKARRLAEVNLALPFSWPNELLSAWVKVETSSSTLESPFGGNSSFRATQTDLATKDGQACITVKRSLVGDVAPAATRELCLTVPKLEAPTPEDHAKVRADALQGQTCSSVVTADGETVTQEEATKPLASDGASSSSCSASPGRGARGTGLAAFGLLGLALAAARRRRAR